MPRWIDLRRHAINLTYGDRRTVPQGKWIVIRIFRIGEFSEHWDPERKESYRGPKYNYDDNIVREISKIGQLGKTSGGQIPIMAPVVDLAGYEDITNKIFAVVYDETFPRLPQIGDVVFEIEEFEGVERPVPPLNATSHYTVVNVVSETGDFGRDEVIYLFVSLTTGES